MKRFVHGAVLLGLALSLPFCSSNSITECDIGVIQPCTCPNNATGTRTCPDGTAWSICSCDNQDGGVDGSAGAAGTGASGNGGSGASGSGGNGASSGSGGTAGQAAGGGNNAGAAGQDASAGSGGTAGDGGIVDGGSCPSGSATNLSGSCDIVAQDCAAGLTCSVVVDDAGQYHTGCVDLGNGSAQLGATCATNGDCATGLTCVLKKCSRACCGALEGPLCGSSGACDLKITYPGGAFEQVCTFAPPCTPWAHDCPSSGPETDCHAAGGSKFKCSFPNYNVDAGSTEGQPCTYVNDCQDSQYCLYAGSDAGSGICRWLCKASDSGGAPDAGTVGGTPGLGGCPSGQTCHAFGNPAWLGVCGP